MRGYTDEEILAKLKSPKQEQNDEALRYLYRQYYQYIEAYVLKNNGKR